MGRRVHALVLVVALVLLSAPAIARADTQSQWLHPVDGPVARPFDPPRSRFGAGHLGADLEVVAGAPVHAAGPGVVSFAGSIAGSRHVVIAHAGNLRTSYSFLATLAVRRGDQVTAGETIGTAGGVGEGHDGSVLHFGLRTGETYVDPMALFRPLDLTEIVHLAPTTVPPHPQPSHDERRGLLAGLVHGAGAALAGAGRLVVGAATTAERALAKQFPLPAAAIAGTVAWYRQRRSCDAHAPPANGEGGSGHRVMLVAGIDSKQDAEDPALALPAARLGYDAADTTYFSYADGPGYTTRDTERRIFPAAQRLATQLRAMQRQEPGREVDLIAHSQGGVVVLAFLDLIYKRDDKSYPPLGTVVTLSSPLTGDALATAVGRAGKTIVGAIGKRVVGAGLDAVGAHVAIDAQATSDLETDSELIKVLEATPLPDMVELTSIGAADDPIVSANHTRRPDARTTTVLPGGLNPHASIVKDPAALRVVRSALEGRALPCQSLLTSVVGTVLPFVISAFEEHAGTAAEAVGRVIQGGVG